MLLAAVAAIIVGFIILVWSADKFVYGASHTATSFNVSPLIVGVVIVGLGTSAPEMLVSAMAASSGNTGLSVGNALGSNITNVGLILGLTALLLPITVRSRIVTREIPLMFAVLCVSSLLLLDNYLSLLDGVLLFSGFATLLLWSFKTAQAHPEDALNEELEELTQNSVSRKVAIAWLVAGMALLIASSRLLVWGAVELATAFGVSDLIIGLTIVAIGTSLPELAASIAAARKQQFDIAIGNVLGSNMFNLLGVLAIPAVIKPGVLDTAVILRDVPVMLILAFLLWLFSSNFTLTKPGVLSRPQGTALLAIYLAYLGYLVVTSLTNTAT